MKKIILSRLFCLVTVYAFGQNFCKYGIMALLLAGWISCEQSREEAEGGIKIENLQTRFRFLDTRDYFRREAMYYSDLNMWRWDPQNVIIHFPPQPERYKVDTHFGYVDTDGQTLFCDVINFPEAALQWEYDYSSTKEKRMEVNVLMSGMVRIYTDENGEKYGTLELTSLKPSGAEPASLQPGVYTETYPYPERNGPRHTQINIIDKEALEITLMRNGESAQTGKYNYEIRDNDMIRLTCMEEEANSHDLFFRVISDSEFEWGDMYVVTAERLPPVMTFKKENRYNN
ncbi:MAG: hypothetical protein LBJ23_04125 [Tannerella sp.]|jgi:hypothetical protein|nr:hypothetical protein [Tannerella sp.]